MQPHGLGLAGRVSARYVPVLAPHTIQEVGETH